MKSIDTFESYRPAFCSGLKNIVLVGARGNTKKCKISYKKKLS